MATTSCSICTAALSFVESDVYAYGGIDTCAIIELDAQMFVCSWENELLRRKFEPHAKYNSDTADLIYRLRSRWKESFASRWFSWTLILQFHKDFVEALYPKHRNLWNTSPRRVKLFRGKLDLLLTKSRVLIRVSVQFIGVSFLKKILRRCNFMETSNLVSRDNILTFKGRVISKIFKLPLISEEEYSKYLQVFSFLFVTIRITWE